MVLPRLDETLPYQLRYNGRPPIQGDLQVHHQGPLKEFVLLPHLWPQCHPQELPREHGHRVTLSHQSYSSFTRNERVGGVIFFT